MNSLNHVGIIPDGNRRWIKKNGIFTYFETTLNVIKILIFNLIPHIKYISIYCLSIDNYNKRQNIDIILNALNLFLNNEIINNINIKVIGNINILPKIIQKNLNILSNNFDKNKCTLRLLIGYDPIEHSRTLLKNINNINYIDLIIRTGFEKRLSGFLPIESIYAEIYFIDKLFPDLTKEDITLILDKYNNTERRFGK